MKSLRSVRMTAECLLVVAVPLIVALTALMYSGHGGEVLGVPATSKSPLDVQIATLDRNFNPKTSFYTGETVCFNVTIIGRTGYYYETGWYSFTQPTTYFVFVQVRNPEYEYVFLFVDPNRVISPGEVYVETPGWWIPYGSPTGTYTVTVYLTNGWPAEVAVWTAYAYDAATFEVRG